MSSSDLPIQSPTDRPVSGSTPSEAPTPLAIVGMGCLFPRAQSPQAFWFNIKNGIDAIGPVPATHWDPNDYLDRDPKSPDRVYTARGGFLEPIEFNPLEFGIAPNDLEAIDTSQLLGLVAARQALTDAGYLPNREFDRNRVSVILGVTGTLELVVPLGARLGHPRWRKALAAAGVDSATAEQVIEDISDSYVSWQENSFPGLLGNVVAGRIANRLDLGGTNCVVDAACASSLSAIHLAGLELSAGRCDVAVTGGIDTFNDIFMYMCFSKTPALSPTGDARPFSSEGDGTILGEGLGVVVLKRLADAERDGDRVYAVIRSIGTSSDGKGNAIYAPSAAGQMKALKTAYRLAGVTPDTIELVEAHGTGTRVGDTVEATALRQVYRETGAEGTWCAVGSVKSQVGHTKAAAGVAGLMKAALALHHQVLPPTLKVKQPVEPFRSGQSPLYINLEKRPWIGKSEHPRRAAVSAFGFGGSNFHAVLEEHRGTKQVPDWDSDIEIVALQGPTASSIYEQLAAVPPEWDDLRRLAHTLRQTPLSLANSRLFLVVQRGVTDIHRLLNSARTMLERNPESTFAHTPDGAYYGKGQPTGQLAVVFPGQGSQAVGMMRDLACAFPEMRAVLEHGNRIFARMQGTTPTQRLTDLIYPISVFTPEERTQQDLALRDTQVAQPAIGAVSLGALKVLESFGVEPSAYAGHSYGELPALCAAGVFDEEALHQLSRLRGHLMASFHGTDAGAMLAVHAETATIEQVLREESLSLVIANRNSPMQSVLSGATTEIERADAVLTQRKIRATRLSVAAGFHSSLVAPAQAPFREALETVQFSSPKFPVFANTSARQYPDDFTTARTILAEQLAQPVDFVSQIGNMVQTGVRTFLEVGPGSTLTRLIDSILKHDGSGLATDVFAIDASGGKRSGLLDLAHTLARLAARGFGIRLARWNGDIPLPVSAPKKQGLTIPICGANYVKPRPPKERKPIPASGIAAKIPTPSQAVPGTKMMNSEPTPVTNPPTAGTPLAQALQLTQQSLTAFQKLQEQTAQLHRQFLLQQESAQKTLQLLIEQQQQLLVGTGAPMAIRPTAPVLPPVAPRWEPTPQSVVVLPPPPPIEVVSEKQPTPTTATTPKVPARPSRSYAQEVAASLLQIVSEKTGYPAEMLSLEMTLDSDLGIDSIKRVEILSAVQERIPDAPLVKSEHLGSFHTLMDIADFLHQHVTPVHAQPVAETPLPLPPTPLPPPPASKAVVNASATLMAVIAEKTGYPVEMLSPEMAIDADLGIDSIKRVEIFSALQERLPNSPAVKPDQLGSFHRLQDIIDFLGAKPTTVVVPEPPKPIPAATPHVNGTATKPTTEVFSIPGGNTSSIESTEVNGTVPIVVPVVVEVPTPPPITPTPVPTTEPIAAQPEAPTEHPLRIERSILRKVSFDPGKERRKVTLTKGSTVWIVSDPSSLTAKLSQHIDSLGYRPQIIPWNDSPFAFSPRGVSGLLLVSPDGLLPNDFHLRAFRWLRHAGTGLTQAGQNGGAVLAAITRLDGAFGLAGLDPHRDPLAGALPGMIKTAAREWPEVRCKAIDCDPNIIRHVVPTLIEEMFTVGPTEVGVTANERYLLELLPTPAVPAASAPLFTANDVVLITGGARGVTAATAQALGESTKATLVLFGRTPKLDHEPDWLAPLTDEVEIKRAMMNRLGANWSPKELEKKYRALLSQREVRAAVQRLQTTGSRVIYCPVDVQDLRVVNEVLAELRKDVGPFTGLIHGAGVLADKRIEDLTDDQFESVYSTKVFGLRNLIHAMGGDPLKAIVLFSSSTGRFGRVGQIAYAAANEVLNKVAQQQSRLRPNCRVVAVNWGPWAGGMVTPALRNLFEKEGVGTIPLSEGSDVLVRELTAPDRAVETTVIARWGTPGETVATPLSGGKINPAMQLAFERIVSLGDHPILRSHVFEGKAVVPVVLHLEWLAHAAIHGNPGMVFHGLNDLRIVQGIFVDPGSPASIRVFAGKAVKREEGWAVPVEIRGRFQQQEVIHSRCEILLTQQLPSAPTRNRPPAVEKYSHSLEDVYQNFLFHGRDLQVLESIMGIGSIGAVALSRTAPLPTEWMHQPLRGTWLAEPASLDAAFQLLIVWTFSSHGSGSLPCCLGKYRQYRRFHRGPIKILANITRDNGLTGRADIEFVDPQDTLLAKLDDYEFVIEHRLNEAFRANQLAGARK